MLTSSEPQTIHHQPSTVANVLRIAGWLGFWIQLGFAIAAGLMLMLALGGRNFNQAIAPSPATPGATVAINTQATTPGIGVGIFWAIGGILALGFGIYLAFRQTRFAKRLHNAATSQPPAPAEILQLLRLSVLVGLVGMLVTILGCGLTLGVLLSKAIAQPQGVAIYDPARVIRSLDLFVAMANMNGITAHFISTVTGLGLFRWLQQH